MAKPKKAEQATTVVYCGPSIPGVAKQYTAYTNGIPTALAEAIVKQPAMGRSNQRQRQAPGDPEHLQQPQAAGKRLPRTGG